MGNNDQLPPPPPPGPQPDLPPTQATPVPPPPPSPGGPGAPAPPPAPPAVPQFSDAAPTTQLPPTQMYPAAGGGAPPPGAPPPTGVPPADGGNNKLPWIIAGAVTVVAVIVVAIVLLTGDDNTSSSPSTTADTVVETTIAPTTTEAPQTTLVITAPPSTTTPVVETTTADTLEPGVSVLTDDTNTFTVLMLDSFETDTRPIDQDGVEIANVTGATDIDAFSQDDDHDTFGISVSVGPSDDMPSAEEVSIADPGESVCTDRTTESGYPTLLGDAEVLLLDGCGTEGQSAKVFMLLVFPDRGLTMAVYAQGPGPSNTDLLDFAQAVVESVVFL